MTEGLAPTTAADETEGASKSSPRKRMTVFRAADATELGKDEMPFVGVDDSVMAGFAKLGAATGGASGGGEETRVLFRNEATGMSLAYAWFKSGYILPRHSHSADCVYYVIAGSLKMGTQTLSKGDGVFIPKDDGYTFEAGKDGVEILEFRNSTQFNIWFKGNDDAHWDRIANSYRDNIPHWREETVKPSDRVTA
jgi:quercetin dioxygenase-like cupin family protein